MAIMTSDFSALTKYLDEIYNEQANNRVATDVWMNIFNVRDTKERTFLHQVIHGVAWVETVTEWSDLPQVTAKEGDSITWTQSRKGALVPITKDMRMFDRYDDIEMICRSITDDAFDKIDQSMADVLLQGYNTSYTDVYNDTVASLWPDWAAFFSASHTNWSTSAWYTNIMTDWTNVNPNLSREALVASIAAARKYTDPNGILRPIMLDTLLVWPDLADLADRIVMSNNINNSANNDINPWGLGWVRGLKVVVWDRLAAAADWTDTSAYWFMMDSKKAKYSLHSLFAQRPQLASPEQIYENKNWEYSIDFYYALWRGFAPYVRWSKWTNAA